MEVATTNGITQMEFHNEIEQRGFKSVNQHMSMIKQNKVGLSCNDTKRYILDDGINSLPYGHIDIPNRPDDFSVECPLQKKKLKLEKMISKCCNELEAKKLKLELEKVEKKIIYVYGC